MTAIKQDQQTEEVQRWEDVPVFATEDDERAYWDTHTISEELLAEMAEGPGDPRLPAPRGHSRTQPISVRLDPDLLHRVKALARARNLRYQTLLKQWIAERLAAEETSSPDVPPTPGNTEVVRMSLGDGVPPGVIRGAAQLSFVDIDHEALARSAAHAGPHDEAILAAIAQTQQSLNALAGLVISTDAIARSKSGKG
jgi:hypothetical protein